MANNSIAIIRANIPLLNPYFLSFAKVESFDCTFCKLTVDGKEYWGETTALPGYSWENANSIEQCVAQVVSNSNTISDLRKHALMHVETDPFAVGCIMQALDKSQMEWNGKALSLPLVGIISSSDPAQIENELAHQVKQGFSTVKVKVQGNLASDRTKLIHIQKLLPQDVSIRIDANQGYEFESAMKLVQVLSPDKVELFEQPFKPKMWNEMKLLREASPVPLMLDESIWLSGDVDRAHETGCADYIKLKMQKHGGLNRTIDLVKHAQNRGFKVVFGNGVQSVLGCYDEVLIAEMCGIDTAGEYNGFMKHTSILSESLWFEKGAVCTANELSFDESILDSWITGRSEKKLQ